MKEGKTPPELILVERHDEAPANRSLLGGQVLSFSSCSPQRRVNQDAAAVFPYPGGGMLVVADGMGGQSSGEKASRLALESLARRLEAGARAEEPLRHAAFDGFENANRAVLDLGVGAGTTLAAFLLRDGNARPMHVGDSMCLHLGQRGRVKALTIAHSPIGYAVEAGLLDEEEALEHEERHVVSNFVGTPDMRVELGASVPVSRHDTLLVASDGLADNLTLEEIVGIIRKGPLEEASLELAALAQRRMAGEGSPGPSKPDDLTFLLYRRSS